MNDSFGKISSPVPPSVGGRFGGKGQTVQILTLPADLANNPRALRIEGQITNLRPNNTAQIQTAAGNIDVQLSNNRTPPSLGQSIEVEIPAVRRDGIPPKQAIIRATPTATAPSEGGARNTQSTNTPVVQPNIPDSAKIRATYQSPPTRVEQPTPQANSPAPRQTIPNQITSPVPPPATPQQAVQTQQLAPQQAPQQAQNAQLLNRVALPPILPNGTAQTTVPQTAIAQILDSGSIVRLLPTPPAQAQTIATQFAQSQPAPLQNLITQTAFSANLTAQNAQNNLSQALLQNITPPPTQLASNTQNIFTRSLQNIGQGVQNTNILPVSNAPPQTSVTLQPTLLSPVIPQGQTVPIQSAQSFLQAQSTAQVPQTAAPVNATLTPAPLTANPTATTPNVAPLGQIDIQILRVSPPQAVITPPTLNQQTTPQVIPATTQFTPPLVSNNPAAAVTAQVTGFTAQNLPLVTVQWPGTRIPQSFVLQAAPNNLQLGSQLQILPKAVPPNALVNNAATTGAVRSTVVNPLLQGFQWPAMDDLFLNLQQSSPQAAVSLSRSIPNAGNPAQIATTAMAFIAAVRSGDIGGWLGQQKTDALQRIGKSDILNSLSQSGRSGTPAPAADAVSSSDWRAVPLPMFWEGEIHRITLYTRREGDGQQQDQNDKQDQTRFVFDLSLSRMGDIQLDGYLRDKRLDLVVRAQNAFSLPMQQTMRQAYSGALDQTELSGELNFQGSTKNWVHVLEQKEELGLDA